MKQTRWSPLLPADMNGLWDALARCTTRGIHVHDDASGHLHYRSYAELADGAGYLAASLASRGVYPGAQVLVSAETTKHFPLLWLGLLWLGCTPVPLPPGNSLSGEHAFRDRLRHVVGHFPLFLCTDEDLEEARDVVTRTGASTVVIALSSVFSHFRNSQPGHKPDRADLTMDDMAFMQFTSGSTKAPKGIRVTYGNLFGNVAGMVDRLAVTPARDVFISWLPLYHDMGLVGKFLQALLTQHDLILTTPAFFSRRPLQFLSLAGRHGATICSMPNFAYEWILRRLSTRQPPSFSLAAFRWLGVGAEPVNPSAIGKFEEKLAQYGLKRGVVSPCYGLAEATLAVTIGTPGTGYECVVSDGETHVTCGEPLDSMHVAVVGEPVGHIRVRGPSVPETALVNGEIVRQLDDDGFHDTGDLGFFRNGKLVVLGRADEMFIINGTNHFPYDIESVVRDIPGVMRRRVVCFFTPDRDNEHHGQLVVLYETPPHSPAETRAMRARIAAAVAAHTGLGVHVILGVPPRSIPVTSSGKLQRNRARELFRRGYFDSQPEEAYP